MKIIEGTLGALTVAGAAARVAFSLPCAGLLVLFFSSYNTPMVALGKYLGAAMK